MTQIKSQITQIRKTQGDREWERVERHPRFCSDCVTLLSIAQNLPSDEELKKIKVSKEWIEKVKRIADERREKEYE